MSDDKPVFVQIVELLDVAEAVANHDPVVVITIRPDPPTFRPHNIALTKGQAWRLATDLQRLLIPLVLLLTATVAGCGTRVELESVNWKSSSGANAKTVAEVDVLRSRPPEPVAEIHATELPPPQPVASENAPVTISGNTIIVNYRGGDVTYHTETHVHVHEPPAPRVEERIVVQRDTEAESPRQVDERCERLAREHARRVETWKQFPFGR